MRRVGVSGKDVIVSDKIGAAAGRVGYLIEWGTCQELRQHGRFSVVVFLRNYRVIVRFNRRVGVGVGEGEDVGIVLRDLGFDDYNVVKVTVLVLLCG